VDAERDSLRYFIGLLLQAFPKSPLLLRRIREAGIMRYLAPLSVEADSPLPPTGGMFPQGESFSRYLINNWENDIEKIYL
jgi:hypothetical protein